MFTNINSDDQLVQETFAEYLEKVLAWNDVYAYNAETIGRQIMLWRTAERVVVQVLALLYVICAMNREIQL